jgi:iron complex outermembrane receptor protein
VQDEWNLHPVKLTLGVKAERNSYTGLEWLPNARVAWEPAPGSLLWGGWSRVVRTPARIDRDLLAPPLLQPSPDFTSEVARITEVGVRGRLLASASMSATVFHHDFTRLRSLAPQAGGARFANDARGSLTGIEAWGEFRPAEHWRVQAGFVHQRPRYAAGVGSAPPVLTQGNDPRTRVTLQATWDLDPVTELFVAARRVGGLPRPAVPAYTAIDARLAWQAAPALELAVLLRNLGGRHAEWGGAGRAEYGRSALLQASWRY